MKKIWALKYFGYFTLSITLLFIGYVVYLYFVPVKLFTFENYNNISVDKTEYARGERISYKLQYCKKKRMMGTISRALINGVRITYTPIVSDSLAGCHTIVINDLIIPDFAEKGVNHIEISGEYKVNPLQTYKVNLRTVDFIIK